jgi:phosphoribosylaminoimidazole-succinocarboxamide synthase
LWMRDQGFEYGGPKPEITDDVRMMLGARYIDLYERMTGESFVPPSDADITSRIKANLEPYRLQVTV